MLVTPNRDGRISVQEIVQSLLQPWLQQVQSADVDVCYFRRQIVTPTICSPVAACSAHLLQNFTSFARFVVLRQLLRVLRKWKRQRTHREAPRLELLSARLLAEQMNGRDVSLTLDTLAQELQAQGKHDEAEPLYREALKLDREALGTRHPNTIIALNNLAQVLQAQGKHDEAEPLCHEALEWRRETLGDRHPDTLSSINDLGVLLQTQGDLASAEPLQREALKLRRETLGSRHPSTLNSINNLGALLKAKGDLANAEVLYSEALEVYRETLGTQHFVTRMSINNLDQLLEEKGDPLAWLSTLIGVCA